MNARLGFVPREGLGEASRGRFGSPALPGLSIALAVSAIGVDAATYETRNILDGVAGLEGLVDIDANLWGSVMGPVTSVLLWSGKYKLIEKALVGPVSIMAVSLLIDTILIGPDLGAPARRPIPSVPEGSAFLTTGLTGTTVIGYNPFLHAGSVQERWVGPEELNESQADTVLSIVLGDFITISILVAAAVALPTGTNIQDMSTMVEQLEPLVGTQAKVFFDIELLVAGFTSTTTAPLANAHAAAGALSWDTDLQSTKFRAVWGSTLSVGIVLPAVGYSPVQAIVFAQVVNDVLLLIVAVFLTYVMSDHDILRSYANFTPQNVVGGPVMLVVIWSGLRTLYTVTTDMGVF